MAGVKMEGDEGKMVGESTVPAIGGSEGRAGMSPEAVTSKVTETAHLNDARAEGVNYTETPGMDVTTRAYPKGTAMTDSTPGDPVN